jgi:hypothetical protein
VVHLGEAHWQYEGVEITPAARPLIRNGSPGAPTSSLAGIAFGQGRSAQSVFATP